jgi:hypothetical protein
VTQLCVHEDALGVVAQLLSCSVAPAGRPRKCVAYYNIN